MAFSLWYVFKWNAFRQPQDKAGGHCRLQAAILLQRPSFMSGGARVMAILSSGFMLSLVGSSLRSMLDTQSESMLSRRVLRTITFQLTQRALVSGDNGHIIRRSSLTWRFDFQVPVVDLVHLLHWLPCRSKTLGRTQQMSVFRHEGHSLHRRDCELLCRRQEERCCLSSNAWTRSIGNAQAGTKSGAGFVHMRLI